MKHQCDIRLFWKLITQLKSSTARIYRYPAIEHKGNSSEILLHGDSNAFAKYFCDIYNPGEDTSYDSDFFMTVENSYSDLKHAHSLSTEFPGGAVSVDEPLLVISNAGKHPALIVYKTNTSYMVEYIWPNALRTSLMQF